MRTISEEEYVKKVSNFLEKNRYLTWKECIPNECKDWEKSFRIDLIFYRQDIGYIAVEFKCINILGQGGIIAGGLEQIKKYRNLHFFEENNVSISKWCMCLFYEKTEYYNIERTLCFIKEFLNFYDVSLMEFIEYETHTWDRIVIDKLKPNNIKIGEQYGQSND